jgi:glycosyltransferase involved in cell wall biosynthesis
MTDRAPIIQPRFSIVIASRNAEATIGRTLQSLVDQAYPNLQVVCIDGASTDGTLAVIKRYGDLVSTLVSEPDRNVADALNKGFKRTDGVLLGYVNADDALVPDALAKAARLFQENPDVDVISGGCHRVYADGSDCTMQVRPDFLEVLSLMNPLEQPSTFWRRPAWERAGLFDVSYFLAFDWEYWNRLRRSGARFLTTDMVFAHYYFSDTNLTSTGGLEVVREMFRITRTYGPYNGFVAYLYLAFYNFFDLRGYYDKPFSELPRRRQLVFGLTLKLLYGILGRRIVNSYNWNFASKQQRGLVWYK